MIDTMEDSLLMTWFPDSRDRSIEGTTQVGFTVCDPTEIEIGETYKAERKDEFFITKRQPHTFSNYYFSGEPLHPHERVVEVLAMGVSVNDEEYLCCDKIRPRRILMDEEDFTRALHDAPLRVSRTNPIRGLKGVSSEYKDNRGFTCHVGDVIEDLLHYPLFSSGGIPFTLTLHETLDYWMTIEERMAGFDDKFKICPVGKEARLLEVEGWGEVALHMQSAVCTSMRVVREIGPEEIRAIHDEEKREEYRYRQKDLLAGLNMELSSRLKRKRYRRRVDTSDNDKNGGI